MLAKPWFFLAVDSVTEAQKWLTGLELLWKETLKAPTPVLIERYTHTHTHTQRGSHDSDLRFAASSWLRKQMYSVNQTKTNR